MRRQVNGTCVKRWKEQSARNGAKRNEKRECTNACARQGWGEGGGLEGEGNSEKRGKPVEISRRKGEGRQIGTRSASVRFVSPYGRWIWRQGNEGRKRVSSWESSFFFWENIRIFRTDFDCSGRKISFSCIRKWNFRQWQVFEWLDNTICFTCSKFHVDLVTSWIDPNPQIRESNYKNVKHFN